MGVCRLKLFFRRALQIDPFDAVPFDTVFILFFADAPFEFVAVGTVPISCFVESVRVAIIITAHSPEGFIGFPALFRTDQSAAFIGDDIAFCVYSAAVVFALCRDPVVLRFDGVRIDDFDLDSDMFSDFAAVFRCLGP